MIDDVIVVGGGAAGLAAATFTARANPALRVRIFDGARTPGAKILVSGGSRCNVTNRVVSERDFNGGRATIVRQILRAFPSSDAIRFFEALGVPLHEEPGGKMFPDSHRSRDVLNALLDAAQRAGTTLEMNRRVLGIRRGEDGFVLETSAGTEGCRGVVLATGGLSLPKTGSDGAGYVMARALGHTIVPTTPALVPLLLEGSSAYWSGISGVTLDAALTLGSRAGSRTFRGSLLWTHFGISGPAALDISRHWLRAVMDGTEVRVTASFVPDATFEQLEGRMLTLQRETPRASIATGVAGFVPASLAAVVIDRTGVPGERPLADLTRADRRTLVQALSAWPLEVRGSRGYAHAEVTAGGVPLEEIDPRTMASRRCPGLFLVGEVLDVDGRLGGFNFQWAWSSAFVAGRAIGRLSGDTAG